MSSRGATQAVGFDLELVAGGNVNTGVSDFEKRFGAATSLENDMLLLASSIFVADIACKRGERENINRSIYLKVPVINFAALEAERRHLEYILHVLSDDNWTLEFIREDGPPEDRQSWAPSAGHTLLFSGGLDSFCGAVDLIQANGANELLLSSHVTYNTSTIRAQRECCRFLSQKFAQEIDRVEIRTGPITAEGFERPSDDPEVSQRTRSFMFLTIASLSARRTGKNKIVYIAENGQMAIHVPLSAARDGAFSTRTAHPEFVAEVSRFLSSVLSFPIQVVNPYLYKTKAEVVARVATQFPEAIPYTNSCWRSARVSDHCGICVPCILRRISLEVHGINQTSCWAKDLFAADVGQLDYSDEGKRNISEVAMFALDFAELDDAEIDIEYSGLISRHFDRDKAVAMYRTFAKEAIDVLSRYPTLDHLLR